MVAALRASIVARMEDEIVASAVSSQGKKLDKTRLMEGGGYTVPEYDAKR